MRSSPVVAAILAVFAFLSPRFAFAQAAGLNVSPIQIYLTPNSRNTLLTIRNDGAEEGRYQLDVFDWGENERGEMQLRPTREVVFFPRLLVLKPGEQRNVRVGATAEPVNEEKTYRIFIEELPPPKRPGSGVGVKVLTKIGLPIFLTPNGAAAVPKLHDFKVADGKLSFRLRNDGAKHFQVEKLRVVGRDAASSPAFETFVGGWYILRGEDRVYEVAIPKEACLKVKELQVEALISSGPVTAKHLVPAGRCSG